MPEANPIPIAFYAPLKPPGHSNPSGDRLLARLFIQALQQAGYDVEIASNFRSRDGQGDQSRQQRLKALGSKLADRIIRRYLQRPPAQRPKLWFSYHLYHKAPDWLGPKVCKALDIPYVVAEASYAAKQRNGPWQIGLKGSQSALEQAQLCIELNPTDRLGLEQHFPKLPICDLPPFLDADHYLSIPPLSKQELAKQWQLDPLKPWFISVAMMRPGDKTESFRLLAESLKQLKNRNWQMIIVGDGINESAVKKHFQGLNGLRFCGRLDSQQIWPLLCASDLYLWPAVNEAFGLSLIEAQLAGTAVLAGDEGGVSSIMKDHHSGRLCPPRDSTTFAKTIDEMLSSPTTVAEISKYARQHVLDHHSLSSASTSLRSLLEPLI